mgnify:FL=1
MKNSLLKGLLVFLMTFTTGIAFSQSISGVVSDKNGPVPGASVLVKGTSNGTQTDFDGKFTINNVNSDAVLVVSYIGMVTQEVSVAGKTTVNVVLKEDLQELKEVVVIGYGTVRKKDATGAVDQIGAKDFDNVSSPSPAQLLRGKVAGVQVTQSSGEPGAAVSVRIRGNSSVRSGNGPLIVVDGVPLDGGNVSASGDNLLGASTARNPLNFINQNDIESMSILKDASSTAIYGSRGANGVIVITTKKGKSKEPEISYNNSFQFSSIAGDFDVLSAERFAQLGGTDGGSRSYNWKDAIIRKGFTQSHDLAFTKSTENSNTRVSFSANNSNGIVKNTGLDRYTGSLYNSNDFFNGNLKVESRIIYSGIKDETTLISNDSGFIGNAIGTALYWNPTLPIYNPDGTYNVINDTYINPVQLLDSYTDYTNTDKLLASINTTLKITKDLKYQFLFGVENSTSIRKSQLSPQIRIQNVAQATVPGSNEVRYGQAAIQSLTKFNRTFEHTLMYNKELSENFLFDVLGGYSYYDYNASGSTSTAKGFRADQINLIDNIEGGLQNEFRSNSFRNRVELQSFYARTNLTIYKKFLVTATIRTDGSTKLGANNKYDSFPSVGLGYKLVEEKSGLVNDLKILIINCYKIFKTQIQTSLQQFK